MDEEALGNANTGLKEVIHNSEKIDLNDVYYFAQVVEHGGISAAARALELPKSRVSRRVIALEKSIGAELLHCTTRRFSVTDFGLEFHRRAIAMLVEADAVTEFARSHISPPRGMVRFACPVDFSPALADLVLRFMSAHPRVRIEQYATDRIFDPLEEGFDLCLHMRPMNAENPTVVESAIAKIKWHLFASPDYLERHGVPHETSALAGHAGGSLIEESSNYAWKLRNEALDSQVEIRFTPSFATNELETLKVGACRGVGIVALPAYLCREDVLHRRLVRVLPRWTAGQATMSLQVPARRALLPSVSAFVSFVSKNIAAVVQENATVEHMGSIGPSSDVGQN